MTYGIQVFNADGSPAIDTNYLGLYRIIYAVDITGIGPHTFTVSGFDRTKTGHLALLRARSTATFSYFKIEYPANNQVKVTGYSAGTGCRLLVLAA